MGDKNFSIAGGKFWLGVGLGVMAGWMTAQQAWAMVQLAGRDVRASLARPPAPLGGEVTLTETMETATFTRLHCMEDGIERITYLPARRRFQTPILMQHGMWHGAWCWQPWQELLAEWGWESIACSLPGHGGSPVRRPIARCTLDYYLGFLKAEVDRLPRPPVLMGHSMGGALTQWYLKHVGDLPAAVLVAPWASHNSYSDGVVRLIRLDPVGVVSMMFTWTATPLVRNPERAARALITPGAIYSPAELHARLGPESALVMMQHNPPFWSPATCVQTPMLWLAAAQDAVIGEAAQRGSAAYYRADYLVVEGAGHNLMLEHTYCQTAEKIARWLARQAELGRFN